jgi:hypothetical protein
MATRHNTCVNPACSVNVSGWAGASTPTRVTGLAGMNRTTGARYTSGGFIQTPAGAAAPGNVVTMSLDILTEVFDDPSVDVYFFVTRSAGGDAQVGAIDSTTLTNNVVKRIAITRTCPANTTGAYVIIDGVNMVISPTNYTALLTEVAPAADTYFDGDSPGATWDGTAGLSASTFTDVAVDLTLAATLPPLAGAFAVDALSDIVLAGQLPAFAAVFAVEALSGITLAGLLPALGGHFTDGSDISEGAGPRNTARMPGGRHVHTTPAGRSVP